MPPIRPTGRPSTAIALLGVAALAGCVRSDSAPIHAAAGPSAPLPADANILEAPEWTPRADWRDLSVAAFEALLQADLPAGVQRAPTPAALDDLRAGLSESPTNATRAALLLARSGHRAAHAVLLDRLDARVLGPNRADDAGDCTAAAAVALGPLADEAAGRLTALAVGPRPHPDLEVRTECAATAVELGRREPTAFLLAVLRIDTDEADRRGERLTDSPTTAWARGRAAESLCRLAGIEHVLWTDAPLDVREERALELERLLLGSGPR